MPHDTDFDIYDHGFWGTLGLTLALMLVVLAFALTGAGLAWLLEQAGL